MSDTVVLDSLAFSHYQGLPRLLIRFRGSGRLIRIKLWPKAKSLTLDTVGLDSLAFSHYYGLLALLRFWGLGSAD